MASIRLPRDVTEKAYKNAVFVTATRNNTPIILQRLITSCAVPV